MTTTGTQAAEPVTAATEPAACEDETQSVYAWSNAGDDQTEVIERRSWKLPLAAVMLAAAGLAAAGITVWPHHSTLRNPAAPPQAAPHSSIAPTPTTAVPALALAPDDKKFIDGLTAYGFHFPNQQYVGAMVALGRIVCDGVHKGMPMDTLVDFTHEHMPRLSQSDDQVVVDEAIAAYCPQSS